jgi:serine/threonine protein kinase
MPRSRSGETPPKSPPAAPNERGEPTRAEGAPRPTRGSRSGPAARPGAVGAGGAGGAGSGAGGGAIGAVISPGPSAKGGGAAALLADDDDSLNVMEDSGSISQSQRSEPLPENERAFGRFTLLRRLAYGGMGEIFLARQGGAGSLAPVAKLVVIKRILSHMKRDEKHRKMFLDEARLQALLANPHIVGIHDMGEENGHVYLAMEHVHGPSWRALIDRCRRLREHIPLAHVAQMVIQAARGLSYAHNLVDMTGNPLRIVHRDINPHNLLVNYDGEVKIIDFGIAKSELADGQTETGTIKGKFSYMSPEQSAAMPLDHRSDVFALGICIYELLTLENPFRKTNVVLSLESIQRDTPAPLERRRRDAMSFQTVVDKCLAKNRDDRFEDCGDIARALEGLVTHGVIPPADKPLSTWLREIFADEIAAHLQILEQTGSANAVLVRAPHSNHSNHSNPSGKSPNAKRKDPVLANPVVSPHRVPSNPVAKLLDEHSRAEARDAEESNDDALADVTSAEILGIDHVTSATPSPLRADVTRNNGDVEPTRTAMGDEAPPDLAPPDLAPPAMAVAHDEAPSPRARPTSTSGEFNVPSIADSVEPTHRRARWPFFAFAGVAAAVGAGFLVQTGVVDRMLDGQAPLAALRAVVDPPERRAPDEVPVPEKAPPGTPETPPEPQKPPVEDPPSTPETPPVEDPPVTPPSTPPDAPPDAPPIDPPSEKPPVSEPVEEPRSKRNTSTTTKRPEKDKPPVENVVEAKKPLAGTLLVTSEGYQVRGNRKLAVGDSTVLTIADAEAPYQLKLRARADAEGNVTFDVESEPWAIVRVDGVGKGRSPQRAIALPAGRRIELELTNPKAGLMKLTLMLGGK